MKCCLSLIRRNAKLATLIQSPPFKYSFVYVSHTSQLLGDRLIHVCTSVAQQKISYLPFVLAQLLRTASNQRFSVSAVSKVPASTYPTQFWVNSCQSNNRNSDWKKIFVCVIACENCREIKNQWIFIIMNRAELEEVFNRVYIGQYKKNDRKKVDGSKTLDRNYFSRIRRVSHISSVTNLLRFCIIQHWLEICQTIETWAAWSFG